ncbi:hypothetical protein J4G02_00575 [Candidatus Poribacteria bacterium]|nr:hypothetical protein [Candidatus Poribacteria bacterium]
MQTSHWIALSIGLFAVLGGFTGLGVLLFSLHKSTTRYFDAKFEQVDIRFEQVDTRFEHIEVRFNNIEKRLSELSDSIAALNKAHIDHLDHHITN